MQIKKFQVMCLYSLYCKVSKELHSPLAILIIYVLFFISLLTKPILFVVYWFPWQNIFFCRIVKVFRPFNFVTIFFLALTSVIYTNSCRFQIFLGVYFTNTISFIQPRLSQKLTFSRNVFTPIKMSLHQCYYEYCVKFSFKLSLLCQLSPNIQIQN